MDTSVLDSILSHSAEEESVDCYYAIIGCDELSSTEQIISEYKNKARQCHPDKKTYNSDDSMFKKLQEAKEVLSDPDKRKEYDRWRRSGLKIPFKLWKSLYGGKSPSAAMHWQPVPKKQSTLTAAESKTDDSSTAGRGTTAEDPNDVLSMFRNYEI